MNNINAILAMDEEGGIGKDGRLPWPRNDADMKWFRECTTGHVVVMGRKTWESLGNNRLKERVNVVLSSDASSIEGKPDIIYSVGQHDMGKSLQNLVMDYPTKKIWVIGGANVYKQTFPFVDHLYLTEIAGKYDCDTHIDKNAITSMFTKMSERKDGICTFSIWRRM